MLCGPYGRTTPSNLPLLGFQPLIATISHSPMTGQHRRVSPSHRHWSRPEHRTAPTLAASQSPHTNNLGLDVSTQTPVLSGAYTQNRLRSPAVLCFGMHQLRLLRTVLLTKMPPHKSRLPSSFSDASSLKTYRDAWTLFSNQRASAALAVSAATAATEIPTQVSQAQRDVPLPP